MTQPSILIVEDERSIAETIQYALETDGYTTEHLSNGTSLLDQLHELSCDLILLDIGLPDINGIDLCQKIRAHSPIPIVFLTARDSEIDRVVGLEIGADDYIVKPFSPRELVARVRAILRRCTQIPLQQQIKAFSCNHPKRQICFQGIPLELSRYEYNLLALLLSRPGQVFSREQLMSGAWDEPDASMDRTVDVHIKNIRFKCKQIAPDQEVIITHRGIGYALNEQL